MEPEIGSDVSEQSRAPHVRSLEASEPDDKRRKAEFSSLRMADQCLISSFHVGLCEPDMAPAGCSDDRASFAAPRHMALCSSRNFTRYGTAYPFNPPIRIGKLSFLFVVLKRKFYI